MGVRIDAYAVDVEALARVVERPLWRVLIDLRQLAPDSEVLFNVYDRAARVRYHVRPDRHVIRGTGGGRYEEVSDRELASVPFLQQTTRAYIEDPAGSAFGLHWLLRELQTVDGVRYVHEITSDHRRAWICSALAAACPPRGLTPPLYAELSALLSRLLKGYRCGFTVSQDRAELNLAGLPLVPNKDTLHELALFLPQECARFAELIDLLLQLRPTFGRPPHLLLPSHLIGDDDVDWNQYVHEMLNRFGRLRDIELANMHLVAFIG